MARQKKPVHRVQMTEGKRNIIHQLLEEYDIQTAEDIQDALKDLLGGTIKEMMEAEMDDHLGYEKSERSDNDDYRNGYKHKRVNSSYGSMEIEVPQDRKSSFEPQIVKKRQKDISDIDQKIISMYAKGMTTRQISETIEDIYGFETSEGYESNKHIERMKETLCNMGDTNRHTGIFYPKSIQNNSTPSTALYPTAANTLNRSTTPKYSFGTIFIPSAPTNIIPRAIPANTPKLRYSFVFTPAMISITSETMDSITTNTVEMICILS